MLIQLISIQLIIEFIPVESVELALLEFKVELLILIFGELLLMELALVLSAKVTVHSVAWARLIP